MIYVNPLVVDFPYRNSRKKRWTLIEIDFITIRRASRQLPFFKTTCLRDMSAKMKDNSGGAFKLFFLFLLSPSNYDSSISILSKDENGSIGITRRHLLMMMTWKKKRITSSKACFFCLWKKIIRVVFYAYDNYKRNKILFVIWKMLEKLFSVQTKVCIR